MNILLELSLVFFICLVGEGLAVFMPIPIPASVLSMGILFLAFCMKWIKVRSIEQISDFLLKNMAFFFIPAGVSIIEHFEILKQSLVPFILICLISTLLTFAVTAYTIQGVISLQSRKEKKNGNTNE